MKSPHPDYKLAYRAGYYLDKHQLRRENEAGAIVALAVMAALLTVLLAIVFPSCSHAEESIDGYTITEYVQAIYQAEGGAKAQYPYGIRSVSCGTIQECERVARNTVRNNIKRYRDYGKNQHTSYLEFLGSRYCPTQGKLSTREKEVNKFWISNVKFHLVKNRSK